jgi:mRNA-degrading endonuclease RelE of RelBE toxin-antitoxin system
MERTERALALNATLDRVVRGQRVKKVELLGFYPFRIAERLHGAPVARVPAGDWRILGRIDRATLTVTVLAVGHRKSVYK